MREFCIRRCTVGAMLKYFLHCILSF
ncbi:zinc-finger domain-containing protein [Capnocytophaga leadbetteri]